MRPARRICLSCGMDGWERHSAKVVGSTKVLLHRLCWNQRIFAACPVWRTVTLFCLLLAYAVCVFQDWSSLSQTDRLLDYWSNTTACFIVSPIWTHIRFGTLPPMSAIKHGSHMQVPVPCPHTLVHATCMTLPLLARPKSQYLAGTWVALEFATTPNQVPIQFSQLVYAKLYLYMSKTHTVVV